MKIIYNIMYLVENNGIPRNLLPIRYINYHNYGMTAVVNLGNEKFIMFSYLQTHLLKLGLNWNH